MTSNQLSLLKSLAMGKIAELRMGIQSINEALNSNPNISQQERAFLAMQRGPLTAALDDLEQNLAAVEQEDPSVIQT